MKRINNKAAAVEACITRHGTIVGPFMTDLTGYPELTPYKGGWCGNDLFPEALTGDRSAPSRSATSGGWATGSGKEGYKGFLEIDVLVDLDTDEVYLGELNPRISGASSMTNVTAGAYADVPLFLFHLLEFMDVDYTVDVEEINERWRELAAVDVWAQLIMKEPNDAVERILAAPRDRHAGTWPRTAACTSPASANDWHDVTHEDEAFFLRVYAPGDFRFKGADLGILVTKGRMQTAEGLTAALPQLHRRHPRDVCERAAARAPECDTHQLREVAAAVSRAPAPTALDDADRPRPAAPALRNRLGYPGRVLARGDERPDGVEQVDRVLSGRPGRELHRHGARRPVHQHHLSVDAQAQVQIPEHPRHEPELVAVPAAGEKRLGVRGRERRPDIGVDGAGLGQPLLGHHGLFADDSVVEQQLPEPRQVPGVRRHSTVVDRGTDCVAGDVGVELGAHRLPDQRRDQVGHPRARGTLAHPAEHVGVCRAVDERPAVRGTDEPGWRGRHTCRRVRRCRSGSGRQPMERSMTRTSASRHRCTSSLNATPVRMSSRLRTVAPP